MSKIVTSGRPGDDDFFEKSGNFEEGGKLTHTPFLVFEEKEDIISIRIIEKASELLRYTDETKVMNQWQGNYRSDFFQFTVGQYRSYFQKKREPLRTARNVVKTVGPHGGFRGLRYEYTRPDGGTSYGSAFTKDHAQELERFFSENGISIEVRVEK